MDNLKKNEGFTLVEILVVMGIIAMLSTLAVSGYLSYRRSALLDLGVDNLISQINLMKSKAMYGTSNDAKFQEIKAKLEPGYTPEGKQDATNKKDFAKCYGVVFEKTEDVFSAKSFNVNFDNKKVWDLGKGAWRYQGCADYDPKSALSLDLDAQMKILEISGKKNDDTDYTPSSPFVLRYLPPNGKLEAVDFAIPQSSAPLSDLKTLTMKINDGSDNKDPNYQRLIDFDISSGKFSVKHIGENAKK